MAKIQGVIGYGFTQESEIQPGVWANQLTERIFIGDIIRNISKNEKADTLNNDITIDNQISILADPFAIQNFKYIKFVKLWGTSWKVKSVEVQFPRLILTLGGEYNGE